MVKHYADRDAYKLDCESGHSVEFYTDHVMAMTSESLNSKSSIAAELAVRDAQIACLLNILHSYSGIGEFELEKSLAELPQYLAE